MSRSSLRRMVPDRLAPFLLLASGRPESAAARLGVPSETPEAAEVESLRDRVTALETEVDTLRREFGSALEFFDRNVRALESQLVSDETE